MPDDRSAERDLDRFWNDLVAGTPPAESDRLDPGDAEAIRRFRDHATAPQPRSSRARVRARIEAEIDRLERGPRANGRVRAVPVGVGMAPIGRTAPGPFPADPSGRRRSPVRVALAAALVLALVLVGLGFLREWRSGSDEPAAIPAPVVPTTSVPTATAIPGVTERELVEVTIPAEAVPAGQASVGLWHLTLPPGGRTTSESEPNVHLRYVLSGALTVRVDGAAQLLRAGSGTWEPVPVGAELTLEPGDTLFSLALAGIDAANPGTTPAEVLVYVLTAESVTGAPEDAAGWIVNDYALVGPAYPMPEGAIALPGSPAVLRLSRAVLEPRASLPAAPVDRFRLVVALPDNGLGTPVAPDLAMPADGRVGNIGANAAVVYAATLEIPGAAGTPLAAEPEGG